MRWFLSLHCKKFTRLLALPLPSNGPLVISVGVTQFADRASASVVQDLVSKGPFNAVPAAGDSAENQVKIGDIKAAHGGGHFLSSVDVCDGVTLPE